MRNNPLRRFAPSPFSRTAARCGKGDDALAAGRPLLGVPRDGAVQAARPAGFAGRCEALT